ncbi:hypothetical protein ACQP1U_12500 [Actinomycetota bacterium]|nr:hypothetical protein [Micrococcales bacterium]
MTTPPLAPTPDAVAAVVQAAEELAEQRHLEAVLPDARESATAAATEAVRLRHLLEQEMRDVRRLEEPTPARLWSLLRQSLEDDRARELAEAEATGLRCQQAEAAAAQSERDVAAMERRAAELADAEGDWVRAVESLSATKDAPWRARAWADEQLRILSRRHQLLMAIEAGQSVIEVADTAISDADQDEPPVADGWLGVAQILTGNGAFETWSPTDLARAVVPALHQVEYFLDGFQRALVEVETGSMSEANRRLVLRMLRSSLDRTIDGVDSEWSLVQAVLAVNRLRDRVAEVVTALEHDVAALPPSGGIPRDDGQSRLRTIRITQ